MSPFARARLIVLPLIVIALAAVLRAWGEVVPTLLERFVVTDAWKLASSSRAAAISFKVSKAAGALATKLLIAVLTKVSVAKPVLPDKVASLIVTPLISKFVPFHQIYLLALPSTILPPVRSKKVPDSVVVGAEDASGMVPPFSVPAVIFPKFAEIACRLLTLILAAVILPAVISSAFNSPRRVIVPAD